MVHKEGKEQRRRGRFEEEVIRRKKYEQCEEARKMEKERFR